MEKLKPPLRQIFLYNKSFSLRQELLKYNVPKLPNKPSRPKQTQPYRPKTQTQSLTVSNRSPSLRGVVTLNSSHPQNLPLLPQSLKANSSTASLAKSGYSSGGRLAHFVEQWEKLTDNKWVLSIVRNGFRIPFRLIPPLSSVPRRLNQSFSPLLREEIETLLQKRAVKRVQDPGTPGFYSRLFLVPKRMESYAQ